MEDALIRPNTSGFSALIESPIDLMRSSLQSLLFVAELWQELHGGKLCKTCRLPGNGTGCACGNSVFKCKDTEELFKIEKSQRFGAIRKVATRKLTMLEAATVLEDWKSPPGNRLEALVKRSSGTAQHPRQRSVPDLLRLDDTGPTDVEIYQPLRMRAELYDFQKRNAAGSPRRSAS